MGKGGGSRVAGGSRAGSRRVQHSRGRRAGRGGGVEKAGGGSREGRGGGVEQEEGVEQAGERE